MDSLATRRSALLALGLAISFSPEMLTTVAEARCDFARSPKARAVKLSLVRATERCGASPHVPNAITSDGLPACTPPPLSSPYSFDSGGRCEFSMRQKGLAGLSCPVGTPCSELTIATRCFGVLDEAQIPVDGESGWRLRVSLRATIDDADNGDMTPLSIPFEYELPPASDGRLDLRLKGTALDLGYLPGPPPFDFPMPACSTLAIAPPGTDPPSFGDFVPTSASV